MPRTTSTRIRIQRSPIPSIIPPMPFIIAGPPWVLVAHRPRSVVRSTGLSRLNVTGVPMFAAAAAMANVHVREKRVHHPQHGRSARAEEANDQPGRETDERD